MVCVDKEKRKSKSKPSLRFDSSSKFWKTFLVILAAFLTFVGPTYMVYLFLNVLDLSWAVSMISGFVLFVVGLALILYLIKRNMIT
jgi:ABC-type multidrug transport system fused ATPase/permease subunit